MNRAFDVALGLSALSWAVLGVLLAHERPIALRLAIAALNVIVGVLFLVRRAPIAHGSIPALLAALPSMILGGAAVHASDSAPWPRPAQALFVAGAIGALVSLAFLGRSFALLPARRGIVERGPYRLVRHPAYACELVMLAACAIARPWPVVPLALAALFTLALRIHAEERLLADDAEYERYRDRVRARLVPYVL